MGELSNIPILSEKDADELKKKIQEESLGKQEAQQKMMQKFGKNSEGNTQKGGLPPLTPQEQAAKKGEPLKQTNEMAKDKTLEKLTEYVVNGGQLPLILTQEEVNLITGE